MIHVRVVDQSIQDYFNGLGLQKSLDKYNGELKDYYNLITKNPDPLLIKRIQRIEEKRDKCFKLLRTLQREISPESLITNANPGYH